MLAFLDLYEPQPGEVVDRRPRQLLRGKRPQDRETVAALELVLREHLALDRLPERVLGRAAGDRVRVGRCVEVGWLRNRIHWREDGAPGGPVRDQLIL